MSAPTPAPGDDRPREGYYPDPSIPGYVRYWNGAAWVPGTSRPAPTDGEPIAAPPGTRPGPASSPAPSSSPVEETGPHFFDEDPVEEPGPAGTPGASSAGAQHGSRPEPASAWGADRSQQSGFGGEQDRRVSWGAPQPGDPRQPADPRQSADPRQPAADVPAQPDGHSSRTDGTATIPPAERDAPDGTYVFRRATEPEPRDEGTVTFRAVPPRAGKPGFAAGKAAAERAAAAQAQAAAGPGAAQAQPGAGPDAAQAPAAPAALSGPQQAPQAPAALSGPQQAPQAPAALSGPQQAPQTPQAPAPGVPHQASHQAAAPVSTPMTAGPGGGQPSWAQQVHRLAGADGDDQPVAPWKPPVEDPFQAAARRQAAARPAGLGKRLLARLVDTVVVGGVVSAAAVPLGLRAVDHINDKIDAAKLSGETVTVWLLDGTTSVYLGMVLAVLLVVGVLYEVLPTAKWGRTLGKRVLGLEVRDIEAHEPPTFGLALRRWLVYCVPGLLGIGVLGVLWCLFDRPWHQCWHDKASHTFVAG